MCVDVAPNLTISVVSRQALIALKLLAANPSERKHIDDLKALEPNKQELDEAARLVRSFDSTEPTLTDLRDVMNELRHQDEDPQ